MAAKLVVVRHGQSQWNLENRFTGWIDIDLSTKGIEEAHNAGKKLINYKFNDKDVDNLIEHFRDKEKRKEFFKEYKELEMLYEIISPDAFLRPYIDSYTTISAMYIVVRRAYAKTVYVDKEFQRKTNDLVKDHIDAYGLQNVEEVIEINEKTIELIKSKNDGDNIKIINLIKSIEKKAEDESDDPFLITMAERAKIIQANYEDRQKTTAETLAELVDAIIKDENRKKEQASHKLDSLSFFIINKLNEFELSDADDAGRDLKNIFKEFPDWNKSEKSMREARKKATFRIFRSVDDLDKVTQIVDELFRILGR